VADLNDAGALHTEEPDQEPDRLAQPVDAEEPPRLPFPVVGIGASAGGLEAFLEFFKVMPPDSGMAFVLVQHLPPDRESMVADILSSRTKMVVLQVEDGMPVEANHVYVIRPGRTLTIKDGALHLGARLEKPANNRPVDDFFKSLAEEQRERAICILFSGMGSNGTAGAQAVKAVGGVGIAQDPDSAKFPSMPRHLIEAGYADFVLRPEDIPEVLLRYAEHPYARSRGSSDLAQPDLRPHISEVLALLRARTRQDFSGYKKPTLFRRIERRMGLNQITSLPDYVKLLRKTAAEISLLADDLLIHVTGFFRDAEAWEALRERVVEPLIAKRDGDAPVRCWVTACSSGEEAYSLAMLLTEAAEKQSKELDIKVFATDMADRSLAHARAGVYPGGIETEISPERLERFFDKEDGVYRVKRSLRERVVFAPQNVLQDPPFSRLDICTCRNLLIYLEPPMQRRVLMLLHFGLREDGILFLGSSETVSPADELFEPVDKKTRIFRRVGPTRHGAVEFPLLVSGRAPEREPLESRGVPRATIGQITNKALLDRYTPPAVTVDRSHRIVFFHGDTSPYLGQPSGEPTHNLLAMTHEGLRGTVHAAITKAALDSEPATVRDGVIETPNGPRRIQVTVAPLESRAAPGYFLVTFEERADDLPGSAASALELDDRGQLDDELRRLRSELQVTAETLQATNEEMKASSEEATSINEELQSTNEELETSQEELQSLNEELTTVNAQLQAKMEEHEATSNDLSSLLSSTDIAVIFLDMRFRIRRFTPAVRDLLELIPSDVGRPLSDLRKKFVDPDLLEDARAVLDTLIPVEREITSDSGRWYVRRVLPYRTSEYRIEGVVLTFVDITDRKRAEEEVELGQRLFKRMVEASPDTVFIYDLEAGRATFMSGRSGEVTDRAGDGLGGASDLTITRMVHPNDAPQVAEHMQAMRDLADGQVYEFDYRTLLRDGGHRCIHARSTVFARGGDGRVREVIMVLQDVTERRRAEDDLRASEERLRLLIEGARDFAMLMMDPGGRIVSWNAGAERMLGFSEADVMGESASLIFTPEDRAAGVHEQELAEARASGRAIDERWHVRKNGERLWGSGVMTALREPGGELRGFVKVLRDETPRRQAELDRDALLSREQAARRDMEAAMRVRDQFIATISHELRTPLSAILLWTKLLRRGTLGLDRVEEGLGVIERSAEAQRQLVDDLLDTSRIKSGKLRLEMRDTDLTPLVQAAMATIAPTAVVKGVELTADLGEGMGTVWADPDRLRQVIWNLLANAVKFTPAGGHVRVELRRLDAEVEVRVIDTGKGFDPGLADQIFAPFMQADPASTRVTGGLGLGLAISKELVELHGGKIVGESAGQDQGATFIVSLPLPDARRGASGRSGGALSPVSEPALRGARILLVEDTKETRDALAMLLRAQGAEVTAVSSAAAALEAYDEVSPNLIVSDINLPGEDGYTLMRKIRSLEEAREAEPVKSMAVSALAAEDDIRRALRAGFQQHLGKPVQPDQLIWALVQLLR
jgi:two-component system CheB/CheR fusion protein